MKSIEGLNDSMLEILRQSLTPNEKIDLLRSLLNEALKNGVDRKQAYEEMGKLLETGLSEEDDDVVRDTSDFLIGFCSPHAYIKGD